MSAVMHEVHVHFRTIRGDVHAHIVRVTYIRGVRSYRLLRSYTWPNLGIKDGVEQLLCNMDELGLALAKDGAGSLAAEPPREPRGAVGGGDVVLPLFAARDTSHSRTEGLDLLDSDS